MNILSFFCNYMITWLEETNHLHIFYIRNKYLFYFFINIYLKIRRLNNERNFDIDLRVR